MASLGFICCRGSAPGTIDQNDIDIDLNGDVQILDAKLTPRGAPAPKSYKNIEEPNANNQNDQNDQNEILDQSSRKKKDKELEKKRENRKSDMHRSNSRKKRSVSVSLETPVPVLKQDKPENLCHDQFQIYRTVGIGTFGRVKLCSHPEYDGPLAMKIIKKDMVKNEEQLYQLQNERNILMVVDNPFIVNLVWTFQDKKRCYFIFGYVNGGELYTYLFHRVRISQAEATFYAAEVVWCLVYLHGLDIAYRDLKPENILLTSSGHIKLTDFGFAKIVTKRTWTLCGTPQYVAPEIILSTGHGTLVDWWSLGILIYEMLCGVSPFDDPNPMQIYQKITDKDYKVEYPRLLGKDAKDLVKRFLQRTTAKRLGAPKKGGNDVMKHEFFNQIDWEAVPEGAIAVKYIPEVEDQFDTRMFPQVGESDEECEEFNHPILDEF